MILHQCWNGRKLNINYFRVWGNMAHVRLPTQLTPKVGYKGVHYAFIGYSSTSKAYSFLNVETPSPTLFENCYAKFLNFPRKEINNEYEVGNHFHIVLEKNESRRGIMIIVPTYFCPDFHTLMVDKEPKNSSEVMSSPDNYALEDEMH